jgi:hypothetical protein
VAAQEFLARAARLVSLSLKARHEGCIQQAERLAAMAADNLANASIADGGLGGAGMAPLTRKDVIETIGDVDDVTVADIIATGATAQDLAEAKSWVINDEALLNTGRPLPTGRVGQLVKIIRVKEQEGRQDDTQP